MAILDLAIAGAYALALSPWDPLAEVNLFKSFIPVVTMDQTSVITGVLIFGMAVHLLAAIGLLFLKSWAWRLTILLTGLSLSIYLWVDIYQNPVSVRLAIYAGIAFYLNSAAVRDAFLGTHDSESTVG